MPRNTGFQPVCARRVPRREPAAGTAATHTAGTAVLPAFHALEDEITPEPAGSSGNREANSAWQIVQAADWLGEYASNALQTAGLRPQPADSIMPAAQLERLKVVKCLSGGVEAIIESRGAPHALSPGLRA